MQLTTPIQQLPRIGPVYQKKLKKLGVKTIQDLLYHFPHRYEDFSNIIPIAKIKADEKCSIRGKVLRIESSRTWKKRMSLTQAVIEDESGAVKAIWFSQPYLVNVLKKGDGIIVSGKAGWKKDGFYLTNPVYEKISAEENFSPTHTGRLIPVYPETEGLSSRWLRYLIKPLLTVFKDRLPDPLPEELRGENDLLPLKEAIWQIHFPESSTKAKEAQRRFAFQNLFFIQLWVLKERIRLAREKSIGIPLNLGLVQKAVNSLSFKLTDAQKKICLADFERPGKNKAHEQVIRRRRRFGQNSGGRFGHY